MERVILHCDCNSYFASVECIDRPELREVPMAVCGDPKARRGIILARNELAKAYGVRTPEPIWQALRKCPSLVLVAPHYEQYKHYYHAINRLYGEYTDQVEPLSIDESFLDVTGSQHLFGDGKTIADTLRARVRDSFGLSISVGVSFNKTFAKMGSDYKKPDATTVITQENFRDILWPLPVGDMLMVGKSAAAHLERFGICTIGDLANLEKERAAQLLGKSGVSIWARANGLDISRVRRTGEKEPVKSISRDITFSHDLTGLRELRRELLRICDQLGTRLRMQKLYCALVYIHIKDPQLRVISRQKRLRAPTDVTADIYKAACELLADNWAPASPVRMLSVGLGELSALGGMQLDFFEDPEKKRRAQALDATLDTLRSRFGKTAIRQGSILENE